MATKATFSAKSPNLWINVLNFVLATIAIAGVELPANPQSISTDIVNTLSQSGYIAVAGIVLLNVANPIYYAFIKNSFNFKAILSSSNFWIQAGTLGVSLLVLLGLVIPDGTVEQVVGAIYANDYSGLVVVMFTNIVNPVIRWLKNRNQKALATA